MGELKRCSKCVMPETQETITFDKDGVCNVCRQIEEKKEKVDWKAKEQEFLRLIGDYKGKSAYDCIIPFSGGKDSTFTAYILVTKYKLKPLLVTFDHGFLRPRTLQNNERTVKKLGVDYLKFRPNWQIVKKLMLESLIRKGDFCWHCHTGIYAYPMQIAVKFNIPFIVWGEPSSEYTAYYSYNNIEEVDERRFNRFVNLGISAEDMVGMLDGTVTMRDIGPFIYPKLKDLRAIGYRSVCLGSYIPWDTRKQAEVISRELGWQGNKVEGVPEEYYYEKVECQMQGIRDYIKYIKRGFARPTHLTSIDIRNSRKTMDEALEIIRKYEGRKPASLSVFLKRLDISEAQFNEIVLKHAVAPHRPDLSNMVLGEELEDQKLWN